MCCAVAVINIIAHVMKLDISAHLSLDIFHSILVIMFDKRAETNDYLCSVLSCRTGENAVNVVGTQFFTDCGESVVNDDICRQSLTAVKHTVYHVCSERDVVVVTDRSQLGATLEHIRCVGHICGDCRNRLKACATVEHGLNRTAGEISLNSGQI